ncbi:hypothetical protein I5907_21465 [Panacibacter sp. DH6]|uniref:Uncharacterized protein n=1 Tax=Panacibacter microcysteis TaxID=2793269 RepID=A0A931MDR4_9BACT|nr:hypothetical protein [Panacibacter microcysteis]MBG9378816.1 hypothetical protein [Panacibacter microcysteis]
MKTIFISLAILLASCVKYHITSDKGMRVQNPKVFKYNKPRYTKLDKSLIDTNAIYFKDSTYDKWTNPQWQTYSKEFARFFNTGQVLFVDCNAFPTIDKINNPNVGVPGYFIISGTQIKVDMFQDLNGGQTGKYFGRIQPNGDIIFYEQRTETYSSSFSRVEKAEGNYRFSIWRKIKVDSLRSYKPNW